MIRLGAPLAAAELAWMFMGVVDTIMVGPLGPAVIGAGSLGSTIFYTVAICGTGLLLGMDTLVAQSYGAGDLSDCRLTLVNGIWLGLLLAPPTIALTLGALPVLRAFGTNPNVYRELERYVRVVVWSVPPLYLYAAFRRYLQAVHVVTPVTFALVSANLVNFAANWVFIYGRWGAPALGIQGAAIATVAARTYMAAVLLAAVLRHGGLRQVSWRARADRMRRLIALGAAAALQIGVEAAGFSIISAFAAKLDEVSLAAHSITLLVVSVAFMVPLGISSAAAVRVGHAVGRGDAHGVASSGWTALALSAMCMSGIALAMILLPESIVRIYTRDAQVIRMGALLLSISALFELADGSQVTVTGALRGLGDTRTPMITHFALYWLVGLPAAYLLCFYVGWGAAGLWAGMCIAIILIGAVLVVVWHKKASKFRQVSAAPVGTAPAGWL
jgi:MATE family multidrug resistance protein